ncbi:MAG: hypothetical protein IJS90_01050 [Clostridia bacterium]|nr:hypothetical protein [Clostridia bacterium]
MNTEHKHASGTEYEEALALLKYMADHNAHHAQELAELKEALPEKAARCVDEATALLNASTDKLLEAVKETGG